MKFISLVIFPLFFYSTVFGFEMKLTNVGDKLTETEISKIKKMLKNNGINENSIILLGINNDSCGGGDSIFSFFQVKKAFKFREFNLNEKNEIHFCGNNLKRIKLSSHEVLKVNEYVCKDTVEFQHERLCHCVIGKIAKFDKIKLAIDDHLYFADNNFYFYTPAMTHFDKDEKIKFEKDKEYIIKDQKIIERGGDPEHPFDCYSDI